MEVRIDEGRREQLPLGIDDDGRLGVELRLDGDDGAVRDTDVEARAAVGQGRVPGR